MADPIREALKRLLAVIKPKYTDPDEIVAIMRAIAAARAALAAEPPAPAEPVATLHVSDFRGYENYEFQHLVDLPPGHYKLFTACTAQPPAPGPAPDDEREELAQWLERIGDDYDDLYRPPSALIRPKLARAAALLRQPAPAPAPADHVPDAGNMVAADGKWEEVAAWLDEEAKRCAVQFYDRITRAAALLLRQLPPEGLEAIRYCVEEDGAVIQRTLRAPESWAIRAGIACMSTTGEWNIEPMPSDRTDEWLANHRWPSAADAVAALQQARRQEVGDA